MRGGESVLDYGCGSGILAIAAAKLGAARIDAVDIDPLALEATTANAAANRAQVRVAAPEALPAARYDIVVANILAQPLMVLAPLLASHTAPGGTLVLSGLLESQAAEVAAAYVGYFELAARTEEVRRAVHELVAAHGGSFSAEHGIGQSKVGELERYEDPAALGLMRAIKRAIDPDGIMNPGKVLRENKGDGTL